MILSWRLPLLESELSNKLKSIRMVVVSKDHNHSQRPKIAVKQGSEIIRRFQLPPKPQYILINVKSALKYQQVPMKKEISFTLHGRFIVSWNTRKNISNNWQFDGKICKQLEFHGGFFSYEKDRTTSRQYFFGLFSSTGLKKPSWNFNFLHIFEIHVSNR